MNPLARDDKHCDEETGGPKKVYTSLNDAQQQEFKKR